MSIDTRNAEPILKSTAPLSAANFRALVDGVRDYAIIMLTPDGTIVSWNSGAERINGYRAEEIIGRNFRIFYADEDVRDGRPDRELSTAASTGRYEEEGWRLRKDGSRFRAHITVTPLLAAGGELVGFAKVTQDVTARYEAEQTLRLSEQRFRTLVEQIRDYAIFMLDQDARVATWNYGAQRIKGYTSNEIRGKPLSLFYTPEDLAEGRMDRMLEQAARAGVAHDIGWRVRKDGSRFWASSTLTALRDSKGGLYGYAKVVRDLTEREQAEEQRKAFEAAKQAVRVRDEFLSIAAHELRTPLTAVQLQLQGIARQLRLASPPQGGHPERLQQGIERALEGAGRLSALVETLLDVSRIAAGRIRLNLSDFDLAEAVNNTILRLSDMIRDAGCSVALQVEPGLSGRWDILRIEQALTNLVSNACKHASRSVIEVGAQASGPETVRLWVKDNGPGIPPEQLERIFGRFERAASSNNYGGLGLGLYVTRQIAEVHGGSAHAHSSLGVGSTFVLELPRIAKRPG